MDDKLRQLADEAFAKVSYPRERSEVTFNMRAECGHTIHVRLTEKDASPKVGVRCPECAKTYTVVWEGWPLSGRKG